MQIVDAQSAAAEAIAAVAAGEEATAEGEVAVLQYAEAVKAVEAAEGAVAGAALNSEVAAAEGEHELSHADDLLSQALTQVLSQTTKVEQDQEKSLQKKTKVKKESGQKAATAQEEDARLERERALIRSIVGKICLVAKPDGSDIFKVNCVVPLFLTVNYCEVSLLLI